MKLHLLVPAIFTAAGISASAAITSGDIAFVMLNADDTDSFAWVALKEIPATTTIHFTDSSYGNDSGSFEAFHRFSEHLDSGGGGPLS